MSLPRTAMANNLSGIETWGSRQQRYQRAGEAGARSHELLETAHETRYDASDTIREASLTSNQRHSFSRTPKWNSTLASLNLFRLMPVGYGSQVPNDQNVIKKQSGSP